MSKANTTHARAAGLPAPTPAARPAPASPWSRSVFLPRAGSARPHCPPVPGPARAAVWGWQGRPEGGACREWLGQDPGSFSCSQASQPLVGFWPPCPQHVVQIMVSASIYFKCFIPEGLLGHLSARNHVQFSDSRRQETGGQEPGTGRSREELNPQMGGETKQGGGSAAECPSPPHPGSVGRGGYHFPILDSCGKDAVPQAQGGVCVWGGEQGRVPRGITSSLS